MPIDMIDREKWSQIYDMARYNGLSPLAFIFNAWADRESDVPKHWGDATEDEIYQACLRYSRSRTNWPKEA